mgnify:CR=1 FL=1
MNTLVRRRLELKPGKREELLELLKEFKEHLKKEEELDGFMIMTPKEEEDVIDIGFLLKEGADWDKRLEKEHVKSFLKKLEERDLVEKIKTTHLDVHHHHVHELLR